MLSPLALARLGIYLLYVLLPVLLLYIGYLIITKAFKDMGFSSIETIIIVFASFLLGSGILDEYVGFSFSNIPLFTYGEYWIVGINTGGAVIPIILSIYLIIKNKLLLSKVSIGIIIVAVITFFVTQPNPDKGIISTFPFWLLPIFCASISSIALLWKDFNKAAPMAYVSGVLGVLVGADLLHLPVLLQYNIHTTKSAVIGGANIFDMIFITGILAVILDGILMYGQKREKI